jgi:hypothetical protein
VKVSWAGTLRVPPHLLFMSEGEFRSRVIDFEKTINALRADNAALNLQLGDVRENMKHLAEELMEAEKHLDKTPKALLFYVTLQDPSILPSLYKIIEEMHNFKKFITGDLHFEYTDVRRGLEACTTVLPNVERFLFRFKDLRNKWMTERIAKFTEMGLSGGDADATAVCPLCHADSRMGEKKQNRAITNNPAKKAVMNKRTGSPGQPKSSSAANFVSHPSSTFFNDDDSRSPV